jgi:hypothetical protein
MKPKFKLGEVHITRNANKILDTASVANAVERHRYCDWGDLCETDKASNEYALKHRERLLSSYKDVNDVKFWIITEHDRSTTTVLLPEDY